VVGIDCGRFRDPLFDGQRVVDHIAAVRQLRGLERAGAIICAESNFGNEAGWLFHYLKSKHVQNFLMMTDVSGFAGMHRSEAKAGITTRNETKYEMTRAMLRKLHTNSVKFHRQGVCITPRTNYQDQRGKLIKQLENWMKIGEQPKKAGQRAKVRYDGKGGGKSDDAAFAIMQCVLAYETFIFYKDEFLNSMSQFNLLQTAA